MSGVASSSKTAASLTRALRCGSSRPRLTSRSISSSNSIQQEEDASGPSRARLPDDGPISSDSSSSPSGLSSGSVSTRARTLAGESAEEAWKRNMREVREWRRRRESQRQKLPLFLPSSITPPKPSPLKASLSTLLASGAALGHSTSTLSPSFLPYVYGNRSGLSIIDLDQTLPILRRTANMIRDLVKEDGVLLIVGTRSGHERLLNKSKGRLGDNGFVVGEWSPGTLTNSHTFFGLQPMTSKSHLPDVAIFLNPSENLGAIRECTAKKIPTVGIVDTDTDPRIVTYPIPANMESIRTAELVLSTLSIAGEEGRRMRLKAAEELAKLPPPNYRYRRQQSRNTSNEEGSR